MIKHALDESNIHVDVILHTYNVYISRETKGICRIFSVVLLS